MQHYHKQSGLLETTYRMNADLCTFPSRTCDDGKLYPAPKVATARLSLSRPISIDDPLDNIIDPGKPIFPIYETYL
jgi:superfamily I DNA and/or RNA helicase